MHTKNDRVSTAHLSRNLALAGYGGDIPNPRKVYDLVLEGKIPAELINGRWFYRNDDLPEIAKTLNLAPPVQVNQHEGHMAAA